MDRTTASLNWPLRLSTTLLLGTALAASGAALNSGNLPAVLAAGTAPCSSVTLSAPSTLPASQPVHLTAIANCGGIPQFAFFKRSSPNLTWTLVRGWGAGDFLATGSPAGSVQFLAWATDGALTVPQVQQQAGVEFSTGAPLACSAVSVAASTKSPLPGTNTTFTATANCPPGAPVKYSYFSRSDPSSPWLLEAAWIGPTWTWTAPAVAGAYQVLVWATDGPPTVPQVQAATEIYDGVPSTCSALSVLATPSGGPTTGSIDVTTNSTCAAGSNPRFSYFVGPTSGGPWTLKAAWIGPTWNWNPPPGAVGTEYVLVWASTGPYTVPQVQASAAATVGVSTACSSLRLTTSPSGSASVGSYVTVNASPTCPAGLSAEFSYFTGPSSSGPWTLRDAWTGSTWTWPTAGDSAGTYYVLVWASDGPYTVPQIQNEVPFVLSSVAAPPSPSPSVGSSPVSTSPLSDPAANLTSNFMPTCWQSGYASLSCEQAEVANIDTALASEGLGPLVWPTALYSLPLAQQEFIVTDEERLARGLPPITGMAATADANALAGAQAGADPLAQQVPGAIASFGNWAEDYGPLGSDFDWMYNDGPGSFNVDCLTSGSPGCWVHRNDILANTSVAPLAPASGYEWVAGAACVANTSVAYLTNCTLEYVLVPASAISYDFTWTQAVAMGAGSPTP
ncbi:MAG: hypothetical protein ACYCZN_10585 [Candidatus Dormibacteria bacterium]